VRIILIRQRDFTSRGKSSEAVTRGKIENFAAFSAWDYKNQSEGLMSKTYVQQDL